MAAKADLLGQVIKLRHGANQPHCPLHDWPKRRVSDCQARNGKLNEVEKFRLLLTRCRIE